MGSDTDTKLRALKREVTMRRKVYPKWVKERRMSQEQADHEIRVMQEIVADYETLAAQLKMEF